MKLKRNILQNDRNKTAVRRASRMLLALGAVLFLSGCGAPSGDAADIGRKEPQTQTDAVEPEGAGCVKIAQAPLVQPGESNPAGALQDACSGMMVRIAAGNLLGSGVIYQDTGREVVIATAGHALDRVEDVVTIEFRDGYRVTTANYQLAEGTDLAILRVPREKLVETAQDGEILDHGERYFCCAADQAAYDAARVGDVVIAMGSYTGVAKDAYAGVLTADYVFAEDFGAYMMLAQVPVKPGMSGGGLFDEEGHLLGILCGVSEDGEVAAAPLLSLLAMPPQE